MNKSFRDWLSEGESIYNTAMSEYQKLEQQLHAIEQQISAKRTEVDEIAKVIGKPQLETSKRVTAEIIDPHPTGTSGVVGSMTRALTGRGMGR